MIVYLAVLKARFAALFQYRAAALAALGTQLFWGIIKMIVLTAFYEQAVGPQPITLAQAITFSWLGQGLLALIPWNIDKEIEAQVRNGDVAYELIRPLNVYWIWFYKSLAMRLVPTVLRCIPIFIVATLFFNLALPISFIAGLAFLSSITLSAFLSASITSLVVVTLFWTITGEGIQRLLPHVVVLLSGLMVPLPLFPDWMQPFLDVQPFRGIIDIPSRLYTGVIPVDQAFYYLGFQFVWICVFILFGKMLSDRAVKQFVIQGG